MSGTRARLAAPALFVALALPLAGCETTGDLMSAALAKPGQYELYNCNDLKTTATSIVLRERQLDALMAKAERGPVGSVISATTYQPEYVTLRGQMSQLRSMAAEKHCGFDPANVLNAQPSPPAKKSSKPTKPTAKKPAGARHKAM